MGIITIIRFTAYTGFLQLGFACFLYLLQGHPIVAKGKNLISLKTQKR